MAGTVIPDVSKPFMLASIVAGPLNGAVCHLYTNSYTPSHSTLLSNLTEAAWTGYASTGLSGWSTPALDLSYHEYSTATPVTFANTSGSDQTAIGFYYTDSGGNLLAVQQFDSPIVIPNGLFLQVTVTHTYTSEF